MNGSLKVVRGLILSALLSALFSSCGGSQTTLSSTTTSGTTTAPGTTMPPGTSTPEEEEKNATIPTGYSASNLFVTIPDTINYSKYSSIYGDWASQCSFTSSSVVNDLTCNFEVGELALFFNGIKFQYNVPANACKYISTYPFWYYNFEVGYGPSDIDVVINKNASGTVVSTSCNVDGSGVYPCSTTTPPFVASEIQVDVADSVKMKCIYDTSDVEGGANCCLGKYHLRTTIVTPDTTTYTDERGKEWGGSLANCIGGAGKSSWQTFTSSGKPVGLIEKVPPNTARTKIYTVKSPVFTMQGVRSNVPAANYFTMGSHTHTGYGALSATTSVYPYFIDPVSDRSGTPIIKANPYYSFECLDEAFETNYRIRVMVQEWNTIENLNTYISSGTSGTNGADENGTAPTDCNGIAGESCNQVSDVDDLLTPLGGVYDTTDPAKRINFFPQNIMQ